MVILQEDRQELDELWQTATTSIVSSEYYGS